MKLLIFIIMIPVLVRAMEKHQACNASSPIVCFKERNPCPVGIITLSSGEPVCEEEVRSTMDDELLRNRFFIESLNHIVRERTPERVVHAKGAGAFGHFEVTQDLTHICKSDFLSEIGKITPVAIRFSTTTGERGSIDGNPGFRGFACKFYTNEGNLDIVGFNTEMFNYKDPLVFHSSVHAARRDPKTHQFQMATFYDIITLHPEMFHSLILIYSGRGTPKSYTTMPGFGMHTFQVENKFGILHWIRLHFLPNKGIINVSRAEARNSSAINPDYLIKDMYEKIDKGDYPSWTCYAQILNETDIKKQGSKVFDVTRTISKKDYPLYEFGQIVLDKNPENYHAQVEQMAFCPGHKVPGFKGASDRIYQARSFAYMDAASYRLGKNFNKIEVNCPFQVRTMTYNRDGVPPVKSNGFDYPNYPLNSFNGPVPCQQKEKRLIRIKDYRGDNFDQARELYDGLTTEEQNELIQNFSSELVTVPEPLQNKTINIFEKIHVTLANRIKERLKKIVG